MTNLPAAVESPQAARRGGATVFHPLADSFSLRAVWLLLRRRKWMIAFAVLVPSLLAAMVIGQIPPRRTASAFVMVDPTATSQPPVVVNAQSGELQLPPDRMDSEIEVITSPDLAEKAIAKLGLTKDPEFNAALRPHGPLRDLLPLDRLMPPSWVSGLEASLPAAVAAWLTDLKKSWRTPPEPGMDPVALAVLDVFSDRLQVAQVGRSRALQISFDSVDPVKAARIANTVLDLYLVSQLSADLEATRRTSGWLSDQSQELRDEVTRAEAKAEDYRASSGLLRGRDVTFIAQQVAEMSTELSKVKADRAQAEARLAALDHAGKSDGGADAGDAEGLQQLKDLRMMEADAAKSVASLSKDLGPRHPKYIAAQAELDQIRDRIAREQDRVLGAARNDATATRLREETLSGDIERLKVELAQANESQVQLEALERDADTSRTLLQTFLSRAKEETMAQSFGQPAATVLAAARPPLGPGHPNKIVLVALCVMLFGIAGVSAAFAAEALDHGFRSGEQIERATDLPSLGLVPAIRGFGRPEDHILERPSSAYGESIRNLYARTVLPRRGEQPKLVLITSSLPGEGKTTVTLSLARVLALAGRSVLVVDCDLRRPAVHKTFGRPREPGLADLLHQHELLERVIQKDPASEVQFIAAGTPQRNAPALLGTAAMSDLLRRLGERFDIVLIDSPPALAVSDPALLSAFVDATIFLVRWGRGDQRATVDALKALQAAGGSVAGVALTRVDIKRHARYGFSDSGYFSRAVRAYYY